MTQEIDFDKLKYGFVQNCEDMQITESVTTEEFPKMANAYEELTRAKAEQAIKTLKLDKRSLNFSEVEVRTDYGYACFLVPGFCDRDALEENDSYQELMEDANETAVNVRVEAYSVGRGESDTPNEDELKLIEQYQKEIDGRYGIDHMFSDSFSFEFELEEEY